MDNPFFNVFSMLKPKRRWAQFSLATMFIVVATACVLLAVVVNRANRRRAAIVAINQCGGWVRYDFDKQYDYRSHASLRVPGRFDGLFRRVVEVQLFPSRDSFVRRGFFLLGLMPFATEPIDDDGLRFVAELTELESLTLTYTDISDDGLVHLRGLTKLRQLNLQETLVTDNGITTLQQSLPDCKIIR